MTSEMPMPALSFRPLTPAAMDHLGVVLRGNFGAGCWCIYPRMSDGEMRALPGEGSLSRRRRGVMTLLAGAEPAPGLLAYAGDEPAGWIAVAPRRALGRVLHTVCIRFPAMGAAPRAGARQPLPGHAAG